MQFTTKELYGGGITVTMPAGMIDASELRQIPDTQEVFLSNTDNTIKHTELEQTDTIIFDLMEEVIEVTAEAAPAYHLNEIAKLNSTDRNGEESGSEAADLKVLDTTMVKGQIDGSKAYVSVGFDIAKKWGRDLTPLITILGLIRISDVETDILVTLNIPIETEKDFNELKNITSFTSESSLQPGSIAEKVKVRRDWVISMVESLQVQQWELFG